VRDGSNVEIEIEIEGGLLGQLDAECGRLGISRDDFVELALREFLQRGNAAELLSNTGEAPE